ncbi:MAG: methylenetetrahydrofolate reductase, partial [Spirochaetales bacterium]|nr:methylenetetrahydrofolate reductase [Spirochaetales bacterium]
MVPLRDRFKEADRFLIGAELVSTRSPLKPAGDNRISKFIDGLCGDKRVDWVSVTDNAGGNPMQAPLTLGKIIEERGKPAIIHISCKDYNRNGLESLAWMYAAEGLNNLLVLSGDYPIDGNGGIS